MHKTNGHFFTVKIDRKGNTSTFVESDYLDVSEKAADEESAAFSLSSVYPVLDDGEGWGRLDLFSAADGYGAFDKNVTVAMDSSKGGFYALDRWRNDISGIGKLTKRGQAR